MKIGYTIVAAFAMLTAAHASAQQVEYVTRNVKPTHAVRFNAAPLRITVGSSGRQHFGRSYHDRYSGCGYPRYSRRGHHHYGLHGRPFYGSSSIFIGGGVTFHNGDEAPARPRTVYGRNHPRHLDDTTPAMTTAEAADQAASGDDRHLLRVRSLLRASLDEERAKLRGR